MINEILLKKILTGKYESYLYLELLSKEYPEFIGETFLYEDDSSKSAADHIVARALKHGMNDKLHYKDIYKLAKEREEMFAELRGKSPILTLAGQNNGNT